MTISISDAGSLKAVSAELHDARFAHDGITFDSARHTFDLKCWVMRRHPEGGRCWMAFHLFFANVTECNVIPTEKVDYYELATIRYSEKNRRIDLVAHCGLTLDLRIKQLDGSLTETLEAKEIW